MSESCPCGSGAILEECCGAIIRAHAAVTAEQLMRSRYTAFVLGDAAYLLHTWHPETRPATLEIDPRQRWLGLRIKRTAGGREGDAEGVVEFVARYKIAGRGYRLHEISHFSRVDGRWLYVNGDFPSSGDNRGKTRST